MVSIVGIKARLAKSVPIIGDQYRSLKAFRSHHSKCRNSYSQFGEDRYMLDLLLSSKIDLKNSVYVDVGAFHPSELSNTYLLYRNGLRGILLEPNPKLSPLLKKYRPGDHVLEVAASDNAGVLAFSISSNPSLSSLSPENAVAYNSSIMDYKHVPVMRVDSVVQSIGSSLISLLSIDVEGLNLSVLRGSSGILAKTFLLCIEFDTEDDRKNYTEYLAPHGFKEISTMGCNIIYLNTRLQ